MVVDQVALPLRRHDAAGHVMPAIPLNLLVAARAPRAGDTYALAIGNGAVRFGPFRAGEIVRVVATGRAWVLFGSGAVEAAVGRGVPHEAWEAQQYEISSDDHGFVSIVGDTGVAAGYALAWVVGRVEE